MFHRTVVLEMGRNAGVQCHSGVMCIKQIVLRRVHGPPCLLGDRKAWQSSVVAGDDCCSCSCEWILTGTGASVCMHG